MATDIAPAVESTCARTLAARSAPRQDQADLPSQQLSHRWLSLEEAEAKLPAWSRLVETALEPNGFCEPFCLLPAWRHLGSEARVEVLLIEAPPRVYPQGEKVWCGLFPIVRRRSFYGLPLRCWELWRHIHCFLATPLVRQDCAAEVWRTFFEIAAAEGASAIHLPTVAGDGPFQQLLIEHQAAQSLPVFTKDLQTRALFRPKKNAAAFLSENLSKKKRNEAQRLQRRLAEKGTLESRWWQPDADLAQWIDAFLELEARGWKGNEQTAIRCNPRHAAFFRDLMQGAAQAGQLLLGRIDFEGQPIAMICNVLSQDGGYSLKIAYDEAYAAYSPGVIMELELIQRLHELPVAWMDSCAASDHPMINHLWPERVVRQSLVVATRRRGGALGVALMPLLRWLKQCIRRSPA